VANLFKESAGCNSCRRLAFLFTRIQDYQEMDFIDHCLGSDLPHVSTRNVNSLFYLKRGSFLIVHNDKWTYIGEVLISNKTASGNRYGSVKTVSAVSELQIFLCQGVIYPSLRCVFVCLTMVTKTHFFAHFRINHKCQMMPTTTTMTSPSQTRLFSHVDTWDAKTEVHNHALPRMSYIILDGPPLFPRDPIVSLCQMRTALEFTQQNHYPEGLDNLPKLKIPGGKMKA